MDALGSLKPSIASLAILLLASPAPGVPVEAGRQAAAMLQTMEHIAGRQAGAHPLEARELEGRLKAYGPEMRRLGPAALPALTAYLADQGRPVKVRLYAAAFLGLLRDPGGLESLRGRAFDPAEDPGLRSACLQSMGSLRVGEQALRPYLDRAAADPAAPVPLWREALAQLAWVGTGEPAAVLARAKAAGAAPEGLEQGAAALALQALSRSPAREATAALSGLLEFYRDDSPLLLKTLSALEPRLARSGPGARDVERLARVLGRGRGEAAVLAARLLGYAGGKAAGRALLHALTVSDPAVVASAAEGLSRSGRAEGAEPVRRLFEALASDERFAPAPGRADPRELAMQVQRAHDFYGRFAPPAAAKAPAPAAAEAFRYEGWPGRGRPRPAFNGTAPALRLRAAPERGSAVAAEARLEKGALVGFAESVVITRSPGRLRARRDLELEARDLGEAARLTADELSSRGLAARLPLRRGDWLEVLAYRSEGECLLRRGRRVYLAACPQDDRESFIRREEAVTEWWLRVGSAEGMGWLDTEDPALDFLTRESP